MDGLALVVLLGCLVHGALQGGLRQISSLVGLIAGLWVALKIAQWVGLHWQGARPAVAFGALHWMIAGLFGLAVASLFNLWGLLLGAAVKHTPFAGLDRVAGLLIGTVWGAVIVALALWLALSSHRPHQIGDAAARARCAAPFMSLAVRAGAAARAWTAPVPWLEPSLRAAEQRALSHH